jgi:hypothetical protein
MDVQVGILVEWWVGGSWCGGGRVCSTIQRVLLLSSLVPRPAASSATCPPFLGQVLPPDPGAQHDQDALQHLPAGSPDTTDGRRTPQVHPSRRRELVLLAWSVE